MKIFISYKFADEDLIHLKEFMHNVKSSLQKSNHELLSTFFHQEEFEKSNATENLLVFSILNSFNLLIWKKMLFTISYILCAEKL